MSRFSAYTFKNGQRAQNRVVVPPMASQTADAGGFVTTETVAHYTRLAQSGAGIVLVEYSFVHLSGRGEPRQLGINDDEQVVGLARVANAIQESGALAGIQLVHVGGKSTRDLTDGRLLGPSAVAVPVKGWQPEVPEPMTHAQISEFKSWFSVAARRAAGAGFDVVELHAAHGYGLNQWLSPLTNQRADIYGGAIENRARLLVEIAESIKEEFPHVLLSIRIPAQDNFPGGLTFADMEKVVAFLDGAGADLINVSSGIGGWRRPEGRVGEGYLVGDAARIRGRTRSPVIGVGGIETGGYIDQILATEQVDFAAVGRAILKDPVLWGETQLSKGSEYENANCFESNVGLDHRKGGEHQNCL